MVVYSAQLSLIAIVLHGWTALVGATNSSRYTIGSYGFDEPIPSESGHRSRVFKIHNPSGPNTYKFGYDTGKASVARQFREEHKDANGTVRGRYGLLDQWGRFRITEYISDEGGFRVLKTVFETPDNFFKSNSHLPEENSTEAKERFKLPARDVAASEQVSQAVNITETPMTTATEAVILLPQDMSKDVPRPVEGGNATGAVVASSEVLAVPHMFWVPEVDDELAAMTSTTTERPTESSSTTTTRRPFFLRIPVDKPPAPFIGPLPPFIKDELNLQSISFKPLKLKPKSRGKTNFKKILNSSTRRSHDHFPSETTEARTKIRPTPRTTRPSKQSFKRQRNIQRMVPLNVRYHHPLDMPLNHFLYHQLPYIGQPLIYRLF